jgi:predicted DNA-binding protein YlxM (UPF0122 family)
MTVKIDDFPQEKLSSSIDKLNLSTRHHNALKRSRIYTVQQILDLGIGGWKKIRNVGKPSFDTILEAIALYLNISKEELLQAMYQPTQKLAIPNRIARLPISVLKLSSWPENALERAEIETLEKLQEAQAKGLSDIRGIGKKSSEEIEKHLADFLSLATDLTEEDLDQMKDGRPLLIEGEFGAPPDLVNNIEAIAKNLLYALGNQRQFEILKRRYGLDGSKIYTLQEVGDYYDVSRQRIKQIESRAEKNIRNLIFDRKEFKNWKLSECFLVEFEEISKILSSEDPILLEIEIIDILQDRYAVDYDSNDLPALRFLLSLLGFEQLNKTLTRATYIENHFSWLVGTGIDKQSVYKATKSAHKLLKESVQPLSLFDIMVRINKRRKHKLSKTEVFLALKMCKEVEQISNERFQIKFEYLSSYADQAYRVLYEGNVPLDRRDIQRTISHNLVNAGIPPAKLRSIVQQMVSDDRFESIGKSGIWSLSEWKNVHRGTIVEIIEKFFHINQKSANLDEVYEYVKSQRPDISKYSVSVYLYNQEIFTKVSKNRFELAAWGGTPAKPSERLTPEIVTERLIDAISMIFSEQETNNLPLTELIDYLVDTTEIPRRTVYSWLRRSNLVVWEPEPGHSPSQMAEYRSEALIHQKVKSVRETVQQEIETYLRDQPHYKALVTKVARHVMKVTDCPRTSFYGYLSAMSNIQKEHGDDGKLYCYLKGYSPEETLTFPQIEQIQDEEIKYNLYRAVQNMNIDDIDMGLFRLGKIFENVLKSYLHEAREKGIFSVTRKDLRSLFNMINCVERNKIIRKKHHLTLLREHRNERAHGEIPKLEERERLMRHAPFLGEMYIKYIAFFCEQREKL